MSGHYTSSDTDMVGLDPVERWGDGLLALAENALMQRCEVEATTVMVLP